MVEKVEQYNALVADRDAIAAADYYDTKIADLEALNKEITEKYLEILYTNPAGFELTARMTTNYRCLLNIYIQRHDHRLPEWREFCAQMLEELPYFKELVEAYYSGKEI
jgi:thymidylate synthase ThyX